MVITSNKEPYLITSTPSSLEQLRHSRIHKYTLLMLIRLPFMLIALFLLKYSTNIALMLILISVPLPWLAVLIANDLPAKKRNQKSLYESIIAERNNDIENLYILQQNNN